MKVVQINCSASGSTGNIAKAIHSRLLNDGHESYIFYEVGNATEKNMFRIGNYFELHSHAVLSRNFGRQGYFSHVATARLIRKLRTICPDVIHLHNLHGSYLNLPMLFGYLKKSSAKILITLHDCWLFTGKCPHFTVAGCEKWKDACGGCPQLASYPCSKVDTTKKCLQDKKKWLSGFGDRMKIIAVSNWLRDTAKKSFLSQYPIDTIYNGINCSVFHPMDGTAAREKYKIGNRFVILGVASNWNESKGLQAFLQLAQELQEDECIVLVGLTQQQIEAMPSNVIGIVRTENQQELTQLYAAADVFVNLSKEETFGLVTAEAMACGTPVIVYDSTACAEIVSNQNGLVLQPDEDQMLGAAVRIMRKHPKQNAHTIFDQERMAEEYVDEYKRQAGM